MGALFASLIGLTGWWFNGLLSRQRKGFDATVRAERLLNGYLDIVYDNQELVKGAIKSFQSNVFHIVNFHEYKINEDLHVDFTDINLVNEYFNLNIDLRRHNNSAETVKEWVGRLEQAALSGNAERVNLGEQFKVLCVELSNFLKDIQLLKTRIQRTLCSVRIELNRKKPLIVSLIGTRYSKNHEKLVLQEMKKLEAEIEMGREKSKKEVDEARGDQVR